MGASDPIALSPTRENDGLYAVMDLPHATVDRLLTLMAGVEAAVQDDQLLQEWVFSDSRLWIFERNFDDGERYDDLLRVSGSLEFSKVYDAAYWALDARPRMTITRPALHVKPLEVYWTALTPYDGSLTTAPLKKSELLRCRCLSSEGSNLSKVFAEIASLDAQLALSLLESDSTLCGEGPTNRTIADRLSRNDLVALFESDDQSVREGASAHIRTLHRQ